MWKLLEECSESLPRGRREGLQRGGRGFRVRGGASE